MKMKIGQKNARHLSCQMPGAGFIQDMFQKLSEEYFCGF